MFNRGKLVLMAMILLGLGAATFAFWFRYQHGRRTIDLWGSEAVLSVRDAEIVQLLSLQPAGAAAESASPAANETGETMKVAGANFEITRQIDISQAQGLVHLRHALVQDASYAWDESVGDEQTAHWRYVLRFARRGRDADFGLDLKRRRMTRLGGERVVALSPHLARGLQQFFDDVLDEQQPDNR